MRLDRALTYRGLSRTPGDCRNQAGQDGISSGSLQRETTMKLKKPPQPQPEPLRPLAGPARCPVCGHVAYSAAGIHPQCALKRADCASKKAAAASGVMVNLKPKTTPWSKPRPK